MFNQWPVIKDLGKWFEENWNGAYLTACFSRSKETIYLFFEKDKNQLHLKLEFLNEGSFLLNEFSKHKKTDLVQFAEIINQQISSINYFENERSIILNFYNGYAVWIRFYGSMGNIILLKNGEAVKIFRSHLQNDLKANINQIDPEKNIVPKVNPFIIKLMLKENGTYQIENQQAETSILYIAQNVYDALDNFSKLYFRFKHSYNKNHEQLSQVIQKEKSLSKNLQKYEERLHDIILSRPLDEIAHIIIANINDIITGMEEKEMLDFYTNTNIKVKLNPKISPQQNAEVLFRKQKNRKIEIGFLEQSINRSSSDIKHLQKQINYFKEHLYDTGQPTKTEKSKVEKADNKIAGIRQIIIEGFEIWIGKSSESNDKLTHQLAHKNDLWFHAFGVSGSHVIIRSSSIETVPQHIIYKAAALAAANSKNKHSNMVPVIKTFKKYVRRPRGANPGQVSVERYDIIDVKPDNEL
ncbi:MAG: NFACT RNA binding domain-containing protein [Bacteroidota bacterium]|nr:NFACT RNA binding domain-containing protein [Bacteroidota bacterium]